MKIKELQLKDFLSFEELNLEFTDEAKVIQGENLDDDDQEANGAGKSAVFYGIEHAVLASTSKGCVEADLVRWGKKKAYVMLEIHCPVRRESLVIERNIGGSPKLVLNTVSGGGQRGEVEFSSVIDGNNQILKWIGITKEDLQNYYLISSKRHTSFMTSSNSNKMEMLSRLTNLEPLKAAKETIDEMVAGKDAEISSVTHAQSKQEGALETLLDSLESEHNRDFASELKESQDHIHQQIDTMELRSHRYTKQIAEKKASVKVMAEDMAKKLGELQQVLKGNEHIEVIAYSAEIEALEAAIETNSNKGERLRDKMVGINKDITESRDMLAESMQLVKGATMCPSCSFVFNPLEADVDIASEKTQIAELNLIIEQFTTALNQHKRAITKSEGVVSEFGLKKRQLRNEEIESEKVLRVAEEKAASLKRGIASIESRISDAAASIKSLGESADNCAQQIISLNEQLEGLKLGEINQARVDELEASIKASMDLADELATAYEAKLKEKNDIVRWGLNFTRFSSELAKESLTVITDRQNNILNDMRSDLRVRWEGFKVKKDGSASDKITPMIIRNGLEKGFNTYSGGERGRVEYSSILTSQSLINSTHPHGGLDFLFTDEIAEGIDAKGLVNIVQSLAKLNKTILLTTHVMNQSVTANVMTIRKRGGKSVIL